MLLNNFISLEFYALGSLRVRLEGMLMFSHDCASRVVLDGCVPWKDVFNGAP